MSRRWRHGEDEQIEKKRTNITSPLIETETLLQAQVTIHIHIYMTYNTK